MAPTIIVIRWSETEDLSHLPELLRHLGYNVTVPNRSWRDDDMFH